MKLLIFGTGIWYQRYKNIIFSHSEVVGLIDNNSLLWGKMMDQIYISDPSCVQTVEFDHVLLLSTKATEMYTQLVEMGIPEDKIMYWEQYRAAIYEGQITLVGQKPLTLKKKIAVLTTNMNYNGGTFAAVYAAMALRDKGYGVTLCAPESDEVLLRELEETRLNVAICPEIPYVGLGFKQWIKQFDCVIVNVLQLIRCASEIGRICPTIWWIHESSDRYGDIYKNICKQFSEYWCADKIGVCKIIGVSEIAKRNFNCYFPNMIKKTLPFGIPDVGVSGSENSKMIFAVIGAVTPGKAQDIFVSAIRAMEPKMREQCEFWVIGREVCTGYADKVRSMAKDIPYIQFKGEYNRSEIEETFGQISVVVCSSLEETMSITVVEGMMHGKVVVTTDETGIADYISDGVNGYVCKAGDAKALADKMEYVINHGNKLDEVCKQARKTYEDHFSMKVFGDKWECLIDSMLQQCDRGRAIYENNNNVPSSIS